MEELRLILPKHFNDKLNISQEVLRSVQEMKGIVELRKNEETNVVLTSGVFEFSQNELIAELREKVSCNDILKFFSMQVKFFGLNFKFIH